MKFSFTEEQKLLQETVKGMLVAECPPDYVRESWRQEQRGKPILWPKLSAMGLTSLMIPENLGGLGLNELDFILPLEETGYAALPDPLMESSFVAVPLLASWPEDQRCREWVLKAAEGHAVGVAKLDGINLVNYGNQADIVVFQKDNELHALTPDLLEISLKSSVDGSRILSEIKGNISSKTLIAKGPDAFKQARRAFDRSALGASAQLLGVTQKLLDLSVSYAKVRTQFGKPIGSFQALKHQMADLLLNLEFARPLVYRAAYSMAHDDEEAPIHVSMGKAYASMAATKASKYALQFHGAIGYSFENDLHMWMKRAWSLSRAYGDEAWHRNRVGTSFLS